jgi:hypothetical protein
MTHHPTETPRGFVSPRMKSFSDFTNELSQPAVSKDSQHQVWNNRTLSVYLFRSFSATMTSRLFKTSSMDPQARVPTTQPSQSRKAALVAAFCGMQVWRSSQMTELARESTSQSGLMIYTPRKEPFQYYPWAHDCKYGMRVPTVLPPQFFDLSDLARLAVVGYSGLLTVTTTTMTYLACRPAVPTSNGRVAVTVACCILPFALMIAPNHKSKNARRTKNRAKESTQSTGQ